MTPKLPDLALADLLVDPPRASRARERSIDPSSFSNVLDAAKGDAAEVADSRASVKSDLRARARDASDDEQAERRVLTASDGEAKLAQRRELQRGLEAEVAAERVSQRREDSRARAQDLNAARDEARAAAKSAERSEDPAEDASKSEARSSVAAKDDEARSHADASDDHAASGTHLEGEASAATTDRGVAARSVDAAGTQTAGNGSELAAASAVIAGTVAATFAPANTQLDGGTAGGDSANSAISAFAAVGATKAAESAAASAASASAWGVMSAARDGSAAQGVDQMARQLGLLRSIQQVSAAADVVQEVAPSADALQQAALANSTSAAGLAQATVDGASSVAVSGAPSAVGASEGQFTLGATTSTTTIAPTATVQAGMASVNGPGSSAESSAVATPQSAWLSASVSTEGLLSAEFVPGASLKDGGDAGSPGSQPALSERDSAPVEPGGRVTAQSEAAQGLSQAARAFDQANAIAQARRAGGTPENRLAVIPSGGVATGATFAQAVLAGSGAASTGIRATGDFGIANSAILAQSVQVAHSGDFGTANSAILAQSVQVAHSGDFGTANSAILAQSVRVAQSGVVLSGVSLSAGLSGASTTLSAAGVGVQGAAPDSALTVPPPASGLMDFAGAGSGGGSETGSGSGDGASSGSSGRSAESAAGGVSGRGVVATTLGSAVGATFGAALNAAGGLVEGAESGSVGSAGPVGAGIAMATSVAGVADATVSSQPGAGVASAVTFQTLGGSLRVEASAATVTTQSPVTADQLPVVLDQTAIDLARLRGGMLTLELAPADLGRLSFEMRIDDSGAAFVAIKLADDTVRALVENAAGALRDSLSREGFKLDSFTVSSGFSSPEQRENSQNRDFAETSNRRVQSSDSSVDSSNGVQSRASNTQVRPGTSSLSLFA